MSAAQKTTAKLSFEAKPYKIGSWLVIRVPEEESAKLSSRGMGMVEGTINGTAFHTWLEPDGRWSHWFKVEAPLQKAAGVQTGKPVALEVEPMKDWTRPEAPDDLQKALAKEPKAKAIWDDITPKAQWEWVRWIRAAKQAETRDKHVEVAISKMNKGMRRPCCFNASACSEPYVSHNWQLKQPA
jgi:hypothetical protein